MRSRLVATYTLSALVVALVGGLIFAVELRRGLESSLDAGLDVQAAAIAADLPSAAAVAGVGSARGSTSLGPAAGAPVRSFVVVFAPDGHVAEAQPVATPPLPITAGELSEARRAPQRWTRRIGNTKVRLLAIAAPRTDGVWVVLAGTDVEAVEAASDTVNRALGVLGPTLLLLVGLGAWLLAGAALRPVERMRVQADRLGVNDSAGRIGVPGTGDELARLASTLNDLLDRLHRSAARQRVLVADAGHELRTPLAVLRTELELADRPGRSRAELADAVGHARGEVERLSRLSEDLLLLARADEGALDMTALELDLSHVLERSVRAWRGTAAAGGVTLVLAAPGPLPVCGDAEALRRVVDNLVANAVTASPAGSAVHVRRAPGPAPGHDDRARRRGPGFPPAFAPHALERFRRADVSRSTATGRGSGLGLAIADEIVRAHGGALTVGNAPGGGAIATVSLP